MNKHNWYNEESQTGEVSRVLIKQNDEQAINKSLNTISEDLLEKEDCDCNQSEGNSVKTNDHIKKYRISYQVYNDYCTLKVIEIERSFEDFLWIIDI